MERNEQPIIFYKTGQRKVRLRLKPKRTPQDSGSSPDCSTKCGGVAQMVEQYHYGVTSSSIVTSTKERIL